MFAIVEKHPPRVALNANDEVVDESVARYKFIQEGSMRDPSGDEQHHNLIQAIIQSFSPSSSPFPRIALPHLFFK
jgi:hypothetical protein